MLAAQCPHRSQIAQRPGLEVGVADRPRVKRRLLQRRLGAVECGISLTRVDHCAGDVAFDVAEADERVSPHATAALALGQTDGTQRQVPAGGCPADLIHRPTGNVQDLCLEHGVVDPSHAGDRPLEGDERIGGLAQLDVGAAGHHQATRLAERVSASRSQLRAFERRG
jgi:hypothetical protein